MVPTPIPESVAEWVADILSGGVLDIIWYLLVSAVILFVLYLLMQMGPFGMAVAGILLGTLISDEVRAFLRDIYRRDFWGFSP